MWGWHFAFLVAVFVGSLILYPPSKKTDMLLSCNITDCSCHPHYWQYKAWEMDLKGMRNQLAQLSEIPKTSAYTAPSIRESKWNFTTSRSLCSPPDKFLTITFFCQSAFWNSIFVIFFISTYIPTSVSRIHKYFTKNMNQHQKTTMSDHWYTALHKR